MQVCMEMERVTLKAKNEALTETQARRVVSDIVERASGEPIVFQNITEWFESWLEMKEEAKSKGNIFSRPTKHFTGYRNACKAKASNQKYNP